jgi:hypothetical protein
MIKDSRRPPAEVPVLGQEHRFGFTFFVFAPLPLGTRVLDVLGLDAAGRQVASVGADLTASLARSAVADGRRAAARRVRSLNPPV